MPSFLFCRSRKFKAYFFPSIVLFVIFSAFYLKHLFSPKACFGSVCLYIEIARTQEERAKGLMFRNKLADDRGMLFVFEEDDRWGFWMKNTLIPLDIIWINRGGKVVDIVEGARPFPGDNPPTFRPVSKARYVLEANSGFAKKNSIKVGDSIQFDWIFIPKELK